MTSKVGGTTKRLGGNLARGREQEELGLGRRGRGVVGRELGNLLLKSHSSRVLSGSLSGGWDY